MLLSSCIQKPEKDEEIVFNSLFCSYSQFDRKFLKEENVLEESLTQLENAYKKWSDIALITNPSQHTFTEKVFEDYDYNIDLVRMVEQLWEIEHLNLREQAPKFSNIIKSKPFENWTEGQKILDEKLKVVYLPDKKQFQVSMPWKEGRPTLKSNRRRVELRQQRCEHDLVKSGTSLKEIQEIFDGYIKKGYVRKLSTEEMSETDAFYLPWFAVIDRSRDSTQCRIVFDAAAKDRTGRSLNSEILLTPNRLQDLFRILLRMRKYEWVVTSDISEMFLKCILDPEDRPYHRFTFNGEDYEWQVTLFGNIASPNGSQKVLAENCKLHGEDMAEATESILNSCYMDDVGDSREKQEQAVKLVEQLVTLFEKCGMPVRKFLTNSPEVLKKIDKNLLAKQITFNDVNDAIYDVAKILGMQYDAQGDVFKFVRRFEDFEEFISWKNRGTETMVKPEDWTKRLMLRASASIFDPLGLLSPFTVRSKVLLQNVWRMKKDWDDSLPPEICKTWLEWLRGVFDISKIEIRRWTHYKSKRHLQIHCFCDASEDGYCVAVYVRVKSKEGIWPTLLTAKSRVTPLKTESIARLELIGCVLATRLVAAVLQEYPTTPENVFFWTDSTNCLDWIKQSAKCFKAFVAHRIGEIQNATEPFQWRHIPGKLNPADIGTRPITALELKESTVWWEGPEFLKLEPTEWPQEKTAEDRSTTDPERKTISLLNIEIPTNLSAPEYSIYDPSHYSANERSSGLQKLVRKLAIFLRGLKVLKKHFQEKKKTTKRSTRSQPGVLQERRDKPEKWSEEEIAEKCENFQLTTEEHEEALKFLVKRSQKEFYHQEISQMEKLKMPLAELVEPKLSYIRQYNPFIDEEGIIRSGSRLAQFASIYGYDKIYPIILHRKSELARLLVEEAHADDAHVVGLQAMKSRIHEKYEIHGLGTLCRVVQANCLRCKIRRGRPMSALMGELPQRKITTDEYAFANVGIDYAGPFMLRVGQRQAQKKVWILVITCLATRAVHLEITEGMTTDHVIMALKCFCAIRGTPKTITSDNQSSFVKANKDLREWFESLDFDRIIKETGYGFIRKSNPGIKWIFLPPYAPHMGGVYEIIVKATKRALVEVMQNAELNDIQFRTIVCEIMMRLNERPIYVAGDSARDLPPITPNDFLLVRSGFNPPHDVEHGNIDYVKRKLEYMRTKQRHFWQRFHKDIAPMLRERKKWSQNQEEVKIGDVVLEISDSSPRHLWKKFLVKNLERSADGKVRTVIVRGSNFKEYRRAIHEFIPIVLT